MGRVFPIKIYEICFVRLIKRVVCIWWCNEKGPHRVRTNGWAMHEATCLKNMHATSYIKEHVTQWSIWAEIIWPISWGSWIHVIWWPIVRFLDRYVNWLGQLREKCISWVLLDRSPLFYIPIRYIWIHMYEIIGHHGYEFILFNVWIHIWRHDVWGAAAPHTSTQHIIIAPTN